MKRTLKFLLVTCFIAGLFVLASCSGIGGSKPSAGPLITYTYWEEYCESDMEFLQSPDDVVTPYMEERFGIKLGDLMITPRDMPWHQALEMWAAADNMPDVINLPNSLMPRAARMGHFAVLDPYIEKMENYKTKIYPENLWERNKIDGSTYSLNQAVTTPEFQVTDPYTMGLGAHTLYFREDILTLLGYTFEPADSIIARTTAVGIKPTPDDLKIDPPIDTPEKLFEAVTRIKELGLKINGLDVIPFSMVSWHTHHFGNIFDFGYWRTYNGQVDGYFGSPGTKEFLAYLNKYYQNDLIDKDYILITSQQYGEKVAQGRIASGIAYIPDMISVLQVLEETVPGAKLRFIPWPKKIPDAGFYDIVQPESYRHLMVSNKLPEKDIERLTQFWDWCYSDEGQEIMCWGPESGGLWEVKDGKKVFKDSSVEYDCLNSVRNANGADKYGLSDTVMQYSPLIRAGVGGSLGTHTFYRSYPPSINFYEFTKNMQGMNGLSLRGNGSMGNGEPVVTDVEDWYWEEFLEKDIGKILNATNPAEFDKAYAELEASFANRCEYAVAKTSMEQYFRDYPPY